MKTNRKIKCHRPHNLNTHLVRFVWCALLAPTFSSGPNSKSNGTRYKTMEEEGAQKEREGVGVGGSTGRDKGLKTEEDARIWCQYLQNMQQRLIALISDIRRHLFPSQVC